MPQPVGPSFHFYLRRKYSMKKSLSGVLLFALFLSLTACGKKQAPFSPAQDAAALMDAPGVFSSSLTQIDQATACILYGIDEATVTESAVYGSTSGADELAIFTFSSEEAAQAAQTQLQYRLEDRTEELRDYMPNELSKLEGALIQVRGASALLVVASDYGPVNDLLED